MLLLWLLNDNSNIIKAALTIGIFVGLNPNSKGERNLNIKLYIPPLGKGMGHKDNVEK